MHLQVILLLFHDAYIYLQVKVFTLINCIFKCRVQYWKRDDNQRGHLQFWNIITRGDDWEKADGQHVQDGLSLHKFAYMALPDHVIDVTDGDAIVLQSTEANAKKVEECLVATIKIGVSCSFNFLVA